MWQYMAANLRGWARSRDATLGVVIFLSLSKILPCVRVGVDAASACCCALQLRRVCNSSSFSPLSFHLSTCFFSSFHVFLFIFPPLSFNFHLSLFIFPPLSSHRSTSFFSAFDLFLFIYSPRSLFYLFASFFSSFHHFLLSTSFFLSFHLYLFIFSPRSLHRFTFFFSNFHLFLFNFIPLSFHSFYIVFFLSLPAFFPAPPPCWM
mmetsp:Transcript_40486/g.88852  ORF Transcript_40486/g.88852 Transcript_40486/m.88852 type:complete len:205 (+) Transcript_40486:239-853(+)